MFFSFLALSCKGLLLKLKASQKSINTTRHAYIRVEVVSYPFAMLFKLKQSFVQCKKSHFGPLVGTRRNSYWEKRQCCTYNS